MKLGSLKGGRDGRLVVVSRDLAWCADATHIAPTLQAALDDWERTAPQLENLATDLAHEAIPMMRFHERQADAPLPRTYERLACAAHPHHVELVGEAGSITSDNAGQDPLMYRCPSRFLAPRGILPLPDPAWGGDFMAEIVVVTGDVPQGAGREDALGAIRLVGLANDLAFANLMSGELANGLGVLQSKPGAALSPVLVTPDELGEAWRDGTLHGVVAVDLNDRPFGRCDAAAGMQIDFGTLISNLAKTRDLGAGTLIGSAVGPGRDLDDSSARSVEHGGHGYGCIAEQRRVETRAEGAPAAAFLRPGDTIRVRIDDDHGHAIFGTIEQVVAG